MTAVQVETNATTRSGVDLIRTPADDPITRWWERGSRSAPRAQLLGVCRETLNRLIHLPKGWDGHRALPPTPTAIVVLNGVLEELVDDDGPTPQIAPLPDGGLEVDWLVAGSSLHVYVAPDGHVVELTAEETPGNDVLDGEFPFWDPDVLLLGQAKAFLEKISHYVEARVPTR